MEASEELQLRHKGSERSSQLDNGNYSIGFICTVVASATYALSLSLTQLNFEKVIKTETDGLGQLSRSSEYSGHRNSQATCFTVIGLFVSGEWKTLPQEMNEYEEGRASYAIILVSTAVMWQIQFSVGMLGLVFEVSSLFSNVVSTLAVPLVAILAVIFFHDKMDGVKVLALVFALWRFVSYIYQHYLDGRK